MYKVTLAACVLGIALFVFQTNAAAQTQDTETANPGNEVEGEGAEEAGPEPVAEAGEAEPEPKAEEQGAAPSEGEGKEETEEESRATVQKALEMPQKEKPKPMFGSYDSVWGKAYLHYRVRPEWRANNDFDSDSGDKFYKIGQRARIGLGLNYKQWLKVFVQVQDTRTFGTENTSISNPAFDGNTDLHQAYIDLSFAKDILGFKIGRQQLVYGDQRLIGHLEWLDQGRVFDGAVFRIKYKIGQFDLFGSVFTPQNDGNLKDGATTFSGLYNTMHFLNKAIVFDLYALGLYDSGEARVAGTTEDDDVPEDDPAYDPDNEPNKVSRDIVTVGTRLRYNHRIIKTGVEVAGQFGYANRDNDIMQVAGAVHVDIKAVIPVFSKPYIGVEFNWASGDNDLNDDENNQFNNLFPTNHLFYGYMDRAAWSNTINGAVRTGFQPSKYFAMSLDYWILAKADADDYWYNASGSGKVVASEDKTDPATMSDELLMGHEIDLIMKFPIVQYFNMAVGGGILIPTYSLAGNQDVQSWAYFMMTANY